MAALVPKWKSPSAGEARDFRKPTRDQRRARILPKTRAHHGAGGNRDHILGGATNFGADRIIAAVKAKAG
jgi:hypothetical protein